MFNCKFSPILLKRIPAQEFVTGRSYLNRISTSSVILNGDFALNGANSRSQWVNEAEGTLVLLFTPK